MHSHSKNRLLYIHSVAQKFTCDSKEIFILFDILGSCVLVAELILEENAIPVLIGLFHKLTVIVRKHGYQATMPEFSF